MLSVGGRAASFTQPFYGASNILRDNFTCQFFMLNNCSRILGQLVVDDNLAVLGS